MSTFVPARVLHTGMLNSMSLNIPSTSGNPEALYQHVSGQPLQLRLMDVRTVDGFTPANPFPVNFPSVNTIPYSDLGIFALEVSPATMVKIWFSIYVQATGVSPQSSSYYDLRISPGQTGVAPTSENVTALINNGSGYNPYNGWTAILANLTPGSYTDQVVLYFEWETRFSTVPLVGTAQVPESIMAQYPSAKAYIALRLPTIASVAGDEPLYDPVVYNTIDSAGLDQAGTLNDVPIMQVIAHCEDAAGGDFLVRSIFQQYRNSTPLYFPVRYVHYDLLDATGLYPTTSGFNTNVGIEAIPALTSDRLQLALVRFSNSTISFPGGDVIYTPAGSAPLSLAPAFPSKSYWDITSFTDTLGSDNTTIIDVSLTTTRGMYSLYEDGVPLTTLPNSGNFTPLLAPAEVQAVITGAQTAESVTAIIQADQSLLATTLLSTSTFEIGTPANVGDNKPALVPSLSFSAAHDANPAGLSGVNTPAIGAGPTGMVSVEGFSYGETLTSAAVSMQGVLESNVGVLTPTNLANAKAAAEATTTGMVATLVAVVNAQVLDNKSAAYNGFREIDLRVSLAGKSNAITPPVLVDLKANSVGTLTAPLKTVVTSDTGNTVTSTTDAIWSAKNVPTSILLIYLLDPAGPTLDVSSLAGQECLTTVTDGNFATFTVNGITTPTSAQVQVNDGSGWVTVATQPLTSANNGGPISVPYPALAYPNVIVSGTSYQVRVVVDTSSVSGGPFMATSPPVLTAAFPSLNQTITYLCYGVGISNYNPGTTGSLVFEIDAVPVTPVTIANGLATVQVDPGAVPDGGHTIHVVATDCAGNVVELSVPFTMTHAQSTSATAICHDGKVRVCIQYDLPVVLGPTPLTLGLLVNGQPRVATFQSHPQPNVVCFLYDATGETGSVVLTSLSGSIYAAGETGMPLSCLNLAVTMVNQVTVLEALCAAVGDPYVCPLRTSGVLKLTGPEGSKFLLYRDQEVVVSGVIEHRVVNGQHMEFFSHYEVSTSEETYEVDATTFEGARSSLPVVWKSSQLRIPSFYQRCPVEAGLLVPVSSRAALQLLRYSNPEIRNAVVLVALNKDTLEGAGGLLLDGDQGCEGEMYTSDLFVGATTREQPSMRLVRV